MILSRSLYKFALEDADARTLLRIYMMERFLERISLSQYRDNFIIKGGILVTSMVGTALRSTMDIDINHQLQRTSDSRYIIEATKTNAGTRR